MSGLVVAAALGAGALGALVRYLVTRGVNARLGAEKLPRAVLIVNIAGSFLAGLLTGAVSGAAADLHYIAVGGFAGGLTTFSTWSVETVQLALAGRTGAAVRNVLANLLLGLAAGAGGLLLAVLAGALLWARG